MPDTHFTFFGKCRFLGAEPVFGLRDLNPLVLPPAAIASLISTEMKHWVLKIRPHLINVH